jgi:CRISPR-associated endonuclease/helicase Cas3
MTVKHLLAKRSACPDDPQEHERLPRHLLDVVRTAGALIQRSGDPCLKSLGLAGMFDPDMLWSAAARGAFLHDLGKANHQFQRMIRRGPKPPQALRHEWISTWLPLTFTELDQWLFAGCPESIRWAALMAALGHHLKVEDGAVIRPREGSEDARVSVFTDHRDFRACLEVGGTALALPEPPVLTPVEIDLTSRPLGELRSWLLEAVGWAERAGVESRRFVALVKAVVIASDVAGSALPKRGSDPATWSREVLARVCAEADLNGIAGARLAGCRPRPFQEEVGRSRWGVTFVKAGCGTGKTVAAYLWAARRAQGRKLFVCYPTTGTATEGYRDYVIPAEIAPDTALLHSRSDVDLEGVWRSPEDDPVDVSIRVESLAAWDVPLVICTTDRVLGLIQNNRRALFAFPSLANGAFVFDEIHQYDGRLFGALLRFLDAFQGAPILLMTASLPAWRLRAIQQVVEQRHDTLKVIDGPAELEGLKRYDLKAAVHTIPWDLIARALTAGDKVLWVANTVDRAVGFAKEAKARGLQPLLLYQSRYRYGDRVKKHDAVVDAFKASGPVVAVTTQVCEVSLDLSADLLVSDLAPVPALIQRMGRLNRRAVPGNHEAKPAVFIDPPRPEPYQADELEAARKWLSRLGPGPVSQADLARTFEETAEPHRVDWIESAWLDGGAFSRPAPLRDADSTIAVIRGEDERACLDGTGRPVSREIARYAIPMLLGPVIREVRGWRQLGFAFVAPAGRIDYSEAWGARWAQP